MIDYFTKICDSPVLLAVIVNTNKYIIHYFEILIIKNSSQLKQNSEIIHYQKEYE